LTWKAVTAEMEVNPSLLNANIGMVEPDPSPLLAKIATLEAKVDP
jgi:hypothetical protein